MSFINHIADPIMYFVLSCLYWQFIPYILFSPPSVFVCSAKVCEEKLRYAAYNCVAIDTDMSPWEEWSAIQCTFLKIMNSLHLENMPCLATWYTCQSVLSVHNKGMYGYMELTFFYLCHSSIKHDGWWWLHFLSGLKSDFQIWFSYKNPFKLCSKQLLNPMFLPWDILNFLQG